MRTTPVPRFVLAFALAGSLLVGCGGSDDASPADTPAQEATDGGSSSAGAGDAGSSDAGSAGGSANGIAEAIGGEGLTDALDSMGLEGKGSALLTATKADRFEMEGDVGHLYLGEGAGVPEGTECMIVGAVLSEGEQIVVHRADGSEITCP